MPTNFQVYLLTALLVLVVLWWLDDRITSKRTAAGIVATALLVVILAARAGMLPEWVPRHHAPLLVHFILGAGTALLVYLAFVRHGHLWAHEFLKPFWVLAVLACAVLLTLWLPSLQRLTEQTREIRTPLIEIVMEAKTASNEFNLEYMQQRRAIHRHYALDFLIALPDIVARDMERHALHMGLLGEGSAPLKSGRGVHDQLLAKLSEFRSLARQTLLPIAACAYGLWNDEYASYDAVSLTLRPIAREFRKLQLYPDAYNIETFYRQLREAKTRALHDLSGLAASDRLRTSCDPTREAESQPDDESVLRNPELERPDPNASLGGEPIRSSGIAGDDSRSWAIHDLPHFRLAVALIYLFLDNEEFALKLLQKERFGGLTEYNTLQLRAQLRYQRGDAFRDLSSSLDEAITALRAEMHLMRRAALGESDDSAPADTNREDTPDLLGEGERKLRFFLHQNATYLTEAYLRGEAGATKVWAVNESRLRELVRLAGLGWDDVLESAFETRKWLNEQARKHPGRLKTTGRRLSDLEMLAAITKMRFAMEMDAWETGFRRDVNVTLDRMNALVETVEEIGRMAEEIKSKVEGRAHTRQVVAILRSTRTQMVLVNRWMDWLENNF